MAKKVNPEESRKEREAKIVDKLLSQLPHADPTLGGTTGQSGKQQTPRGQSGKQQTPRGQMRASKPIARPDLHPPPPPPLKAWAWAILGLLAAVGLIYWPYGHSCDWGVLFYMAGVTTALVVASWGAIISWKSHRAVAHVISLGVVAFTGVLAAREVLPRTGYARAEATWRCVAEPAEAAQPVVTDSAGLIVPPPDPAPASGADSTPQD